MQCVFTAEDCVRGWCCFDEMTDALIASKLK